MNNIIDNMLIFKGHPSYVEPENITADMQKIFTKTCKDDVSLDVSEHKSLSSTNSFGKYTAKYNFYNIPFGYFPQHHKKTSYSNNMMYKWDIQTKLEILDENNNVIVTKYTMFTPCINLYGDGYNPETTYYTICEFENNRSIFNIYNISNTYKKSIEINRYNFNLDIVISYFDNIYYAIVFDYDILGIIELDKLIENKRVIY